MVFTIAIFECLLARTQVIFTLMPIFRLILFILYQSLYLVLVLPSLLSSNMSFY